MRKMVQGTIVTNIRENSSLIPFFLRPPKLDHYYSRRNTKGREGMLKAMKRMFVFTNMMFFMMTGYANAAPPCPSGSAERSFNLERDLPNCIFGRTEGNSVGARYGRFYNVYCPGRMSKNQAVDVANALSRDIPHVANNPIPADFTRFGLTPRYRYSSAAAGSRADSFRGIHHWNHYTCGSRGVATHIKIEIGSQAPSSQEVAQHCSEVNRSGSVRVGSQVNIEYRCAIHLKPSERRRLYRTSLCPDCRPPWVQEVAAVKSRVDIVPAAQAAGVKTCLLNSTDIQCAPCQTSNKLVARLAFVSSGDSCPRGTTRILSSGGPAGDAGVGRSTAPLTSSSCAAQLQGKVAWDYKGSKQWAQKNINRLCRRAENSSEPASCFKKVMHGSINWGGGTRWQWKNAIDLCEGSTNANRTLSCFQREIQSGKTWQAAIQTCGR